MSRRRLSSVEFVAMMAMMFAMIAFSIDAMLPALPEIGAELSPDNLNRAQLILTSFVLGMGLGTFFTGPLSDAVGRKPVIVGGVVIYILGGTIAMQAQTLDVALAARVLQGLGVAGPRAVGLAVTRDLYSGRDMARITSFIMTVFTLVPSMAPALGAVIIDMAGWRGIFAAFTLFSLFCTGWLMIRLPEPLPKEARRPFRPSLLWTGLKEVFSYPTVRMSILVQTLCYAMLFGMLSTVQQIYDITYGRGAEFPLWFAAVSLAAGSSSLLNAWLVGRFGMRFLVTVALTSQAVASAVMAALVLADVPGDLQFGYFVFWQFSAFFMAGMTIGNINAMGMEPVGHIAGLAASLISALSTIAAVMLAAPLGLMFDGTAVPLAVGFVIMALAAVALMRWLARVEARRAVA